jgi:WD40 repeat protein
LLAGDSEGSLLFFKSPETLPGRECVFELIKKYPNMHRIGVIKILVVLYENFIFTISYDQQVKGFDGTNGNEFFCMKNPNKSIYTGMYWDRDFQELYVSDANGYVGVIKVIVERPLFWQKMVKERILDIELVESLRRLILITSSAIKIYKVERGVKTHEIVGHTDSIINIVTLEGPKSHSVNTEDEAKIISASVDNTIRLWDVKDLLCINMMHSPAKSEIWFQKLLTYFLIAQCVF